MDGQFIVKLRKGMGLSRERFGRLLGVSHASVRNWERGDHQPSSLAKEKIERLAKGVKAQ